MTISLYDEALRQGDVRRARARLRISLDAYYTVVGEGVLNAEDVVNLTEQASDAVDELFQGYPNKEVQGA